MLNRIAILYRVSGCFVGLIALILCVTWFGWKFALVLWLLLWGNNLHLAAKYGSGRLGHRVTDASVPPSYAPGDER